MKNRNDLKKIGAILLLANPIFSLAEPPAENINNAATLSEAKTIVAEDSSKLDKQWDAYKVDGSSSASKLVAKRSHSVSEQDETGLAIFLGIIVIGVIVFFLNPFSEKN
jgi:hypothetical protein